MKCTDQGGKPRGFMVFWESLIGTALMVLVGSPGQSRPRLVGALGRMRPMAGPVN
jgi:hypothetical protein